MKNYTMPLILGSISLVLAVTSIIMGTIDFLNNGVSSSTLFAAIIFIAALLSSINLLRLYSKLKEISSTKNRTNKKNNN